MKHYRFSDRSIKNLEGVKPQLIILCYRALILSPIDFTILEGKRTLERQKKLVKTGASHTLNSRHLTGHAIDFGAWADGGISWHFPLYEKISISFKKASIELGFPITWGGDWVMRDGPHIELNWEHYP